MGALSLLLLRRATLCAWAVLGAKAPCLVRDLSYAVWCPRRAAEDWQGCWGPYMPVAQLPLLPHCPQEWGLEPWTQHGMTGCFQMLAQQQKARACLLRAAESSLIYSLLLSTGPHCCLCLVVACSGRSGRSLPTNIEGRKQASYKKLKKLVLKLTKMIETSFLLTIMLTNSYISAKNSKQIVWDKSTADLASLFICRRLYSKILN